MSHDQGSEGFALGVKPPGKALKPLVLGSSFLINLKRPGSFQKEEVKSNMDRHDTELGCTGDWSINLLLPSIC